jgi:hypothetical protein
VTGRAGLVLAATTTLLACRSAAPARVGLGVEGYGDRQYIGALPWWEGPETSVDSGVHASPHGLAISSTREMSGMIAELWREGGRIHYGASVLSGSVLALAADDRGDVAFFRRHVAASGDSYDLENDRVYGVNLRRKSSPRMLDVPARESTTTW